MSLRLAFRTLARTPGFGLTVTLTLALGIGATTALFTVVNAVLLDPLPFPKSRQLVQVWRSELPALTYGSASYPRYLDWKRDQRAFSDIGVWAPRAMTITGGDVPERANGATVSASFFNVVGATPELGSWIRDEHDRAGGEGVAVLSYAYWTRRFDRSRSALGQHLTIDGQPHTIIGIAPAGYGEVFRPDIWIPLASSNPSQNRDNNYLQTLGRLKDGETIDDARRALATLAAKMQNEHAVDKYGFTARPIHEVITENASQGLWVLLGASGLLLLIACANVANLLLARSVVRQRDLAIRASLGASRARLLGQVATESLAIGIAACVVGAGLAWAIVKLFVALAPVDFPRIGAIAIDARALGFSAALAIVTALVSGLAAHVGQSFSFVGRPFRAGTSMGDLNARGFTSSRVRIATRALVVVEMSLALALVAAAGLLAKSVMRLQSQDLGFTRESVLTFAVGLPPLTAPDIAAIERLHTEFLTRVRGMSGVTHASAINMLPIARTGTNGPVRRGDDPNGKGIPVTEFRCVADGYFDTMGMRLLAGRPIDSRDRPNTASVAVLNDTLAGRLFPGVQPAQMIGQQVRIGWLNNITTEVVGVVASIRSRRVDAPPDPEVYVPFTQAPTASLSYVVRSNGDPAALANPIRTTLAGVVADVPLSQVRTLDDIVSTSTRLSRLVSWLSVVFAILAAALAVLGVYSVLSYAVAQRMREFAIRAAVGASRARLVTTVLREGALLSALGIVAGLVIALQASGLLRRLLFGVSETDPVVYVSAALGLATVAAAGYLIPAARAAKADPMQALRND